MEFKKRFLRTPFEAMRIIWQANVSVISMIFTGRTHRVSPAFSERINLAVCGVNECAYCTHLHIKLALRKGISEQEAAQIVAGHEGSVAPQEARALAFATRIAESGGSFDSQEWDTLVDSYGLKKAKYILNVVRVINAGNMCANTAEAFNEGVVSSRRVRFFLTYLMVGPVAFMIKVMGGYNK
jgi:AhpD family alkylhydroperoxidase